MQDPDAIYFISSADKAHAAVPLDGGKYRLVTRRKASLLVKDVGIGEALAYCKRHKITLPDPR